MTHLHDLVQRSYETFLSNTNDSQVILFHPHSRYRSLAIAKLLAEQPRPVFYYSMGSLDVDLSAFIAGFTHDIAEQAPLFGRHLHSFAHADQPLPPAELLGAVLQDLASLSDEPYFLVLDNYDAAEQADDVQKFLETVLMNLPANCQAIINSRTLPRLPWLALIARRQASILNDYQQLTHDPYGLEKEPELAQLKVNCLGPNSIWNDGQLVDEWEGHLPRLLFIFALERPMVTRAEICEAFWPTLELDQAVNVFHVTKRRLHKALGFDALVHYGGYYQVNPQIRVEYDVNQFISALLRGRNTTGEPAAEAWQQAIDLYQGGNSERKKGHFLQGHREEWITQHRTSYELGYLEAVLALAQYRHEIGRSDFALRTLLQASHDHAFHEPLHQEIIRLYHSLGRGSEVASHYQQLVEMLRVKGLKPSEETQNLYQTLMG